MARQASKKRRKARQKRLTARLAALVGAKVADGVIAGRVPIERALDGLAGPDRERVVRLAEQLLGKANR